MRAAMAAAEVGDDVFGDDPTVNRLQERAGEIFEHEAALWVPSGCMGNEIAVKYTPARPGDSHRGPRTYPELRTWRGGCNFGRHDPAVKSGDGSGHLTWDEIEPRFADRSAILRRADRPDLPRKHT